MRQAHRSLSLVTAPANDIVSLSDACSWLHLEEGTDDAVIQQLIGTATAAIELHTRRSLITQTWKATFDLPCSGIADQLAEGVYDLPVSVLSGSLPRSIYLPREPLQSVASIVTYDTANAASTLASSNYTVDAPGSRVFLNTGYTWPSNLRSTASVEITYVTGYGDTPGSVPRAICTAALIHIASLYEQRGLCEDAMELPPGAKQILNQYRLMGDRRG